MPVAADITQATGVKPGDVLAGKYEVKRVIGSGGMAIVVEAKHIVLGERVALKFLLPMFHDGGEMSARFMREAQSMVRIKGENVARVTDVGTLESGAPYLVMEFLEGQDLAHAIEGGPLSIEDAVDAILHACEALAEAHMQGVVHRDLKPSNLFVTRRPDGTRLVKVMDFGIAKVLTENEDQAKVTATGTIMGSPAYMAPEQVRSAKLASPRSDVWSLGIVLYEALVGRTPFTGDSLTSLIMAIISDPTPSLQAARPDVPRGLAAAVERCLEKSADQRFASVAELAVALEPFCSDLARPGVRRIQGIVNPDGARTSALPDNRTRAPMPAQSATQISLAAESTRPRRSFLPYVAGFVAVVGGAGAFVLLTGKGHDAPPSVALPMASSVPESAPAVTPPPPVTVEPAVPASTQAPPPASASASSKPVVVAKPPPGGAADTKSKDKNFGKATDTRK